MSLGGEVSRNRASVFVSVTPPESSPVSPSLKSPSNPVDYIVARNLKDGRAPSFNSVNRMGKSPSLRFDVTSQTESSFRDAADMYSRGGSASSLKTPHRHFRKGSSMLRSDLSLMDGSGSSLMAVPKRLKMHARNVIKVPPNAAVPIDVHEAPENISKVIQNLVPGKEVRFFVPVKSMSHPSPESSPVEYLVVVVKPFKNKAKILLLRGTVYSISVEHRWKLDDLSEFNESPLSLFLLTLKKCAVVPLIPMSSVELLRK